MATPTTTQHGADLLLRINNIAVMSRVGGTITRSYETEETSNADSQFAVERSHTLRGWGVDAGQYLLIDSTKYRGQKFVLEVDMDGLGDYEELSCRSALSLALSLALIDDNNTCAPNDRQYLPDKISKSVSTTVSYSDVENPAASALKKLIEDAEDQVATGVRIRSTVPNGPSFTGRVVLTSSPLSAAYDQRQEIQLTMESDGRWAFVPGSDLEDSVDALLSAFFAIPAQTVEVIAGSTEVDGTYWSGDAYPTQISFTLDFEKSVQVGMTLTGNGELQRLQNNPT